MELVHSNLIVFLPLDLVCRLYTELTCPSYLFVLVFLQPNHSTAGGRNNNMLWCTVSRSYCSMCVSLYSYNNMCSIVGAPLVGHTAPCMCVSLYSYNNMCSIAGTPLVGHTAPCVSLCIPITI